MACFVGLDVCKKYLDVCLRRPGLRPVEFRVTNTAEGFGVLWGKVSSACKGESVHFCMESTGGYEMDAAAFLCSEGQVVSVVNPARVKSFAVARGFQNKTDRADARTIAEYAELMTPRVWHLSDPKLLELSQLHRHRVRLLEEFLRIGNWLEHRSHRGEFEVRQQLTMRTLVELSLTQTENEIVRQLEQLPQARAQVEALMKLPGIGLAFAVALLSELGPVVDYDSAESYAARAGLHPIRRESGDSRRRSRMSKAGNAWVRSAGWMPALRALGTNPPIMALARRMEGSGRHPKQIRAAALRKLVMQAYGVLKALHEGREPYFPVTEAQKESEEKGKPQTAKRLQYRPTENRLRARKDTFENPAVKRGLTRTRKETVPKKSPQIPVYD